MIYATPGQRVAAQLHRAVRDVRNIASQAGHSGSSESSADSAADAVAMLAAHLPLQAAEHDRAAGQLRRAWSGQATASVQLPAVPVAPRWARRHAQAALGGWLVPPDTAETAVLLVSELVTNAVMATALQKAGGADLPLITQTLRCQPGRIVIEVSDSDPNPPVLADAMPEAESGRGLMLVQAFSKEWSYYFPPSGGKTIYAVMDVPGWQMAVGPL